MSSREVETAIERPSRRWAWSRVKGNWGIGRLKQYYSLVLILVMWEALGRLIGDPLFLPTLTEVLAKYAELAGNGEIFKHLQISLIRALSGFGAAALIGVALGLLMGWYSSWENFWNNLISISYPVPKIALVPLFILWLGIGNVSKIAMIFTAAVFPVIINTYAGVKGVRKNLIWRALTMGASQGEVLRKVMLPAALPSIFTGLRLSMGVSWILLIAAEMVSANTGLGFLILFAEQMYETQIVFVGLLTVAACGFAFDRLVQYATRRLCYWHYQEAY